MPPRGQHDGQLRRDPLSRKYDPWARAFLEQLIADRGNWHGRMVYSRGPVDHGGLTHTERAIVRSLYWNLGHAASSGLRSRSPWSLQVAWMGPKRRGAFRSRILAARVTSKRAGYKAVLDGRSSPSYLGRPTSRGARRGEPWQPKSP